MNIKNGILNVLKHGNKHDLIHFVTIRDQKVKTLKSNHRNNTENHAAKENRKKSKLPEGGLTRTFLNTYSNDDDTLPTENDDTLLNKNIFDP